MNPVSSLAKVGTGFVNVLVCTYVHTYVHRLRMGCFLTGLQPLARIGQVCAYYAHTLGVFING